MGTRIKSINIHKKKSMNLVYLQNFSGCKWLSIYKGEGAWASCVPVKEEMKLTRTDLSNAKAFDMFVMT